MAIHHNVTDHDQGSMDIRQQEQTFHGFIKVCIGVVIVAAVVLIFMALVNA